MTATLTRPDDLDIEVYTLGQMLDQGMWKPHEVDTIRRQLEDRKSQLRCGLGSATQIYWTLKVQELDADSRVRRDPVYGWMLDRWVSDPG